MDNSNGHGSQTMEELVAVVELLRQQNEQLQNTMIAVQHQHPQPPPEDEDPDDSINTQPSS